MKFKIGELVFMKGLVARQTLNEDELYISFLNSDKLVALNTLDLLTKEEMLAELTKPELPKVGYVYSEPPYHKTNAKVVFVNEKDVVLEDDGKFLRVVSIKTIQENFKRVSYDQ